MSSISTIALSGMNAAARRLEVSASNVANVASTGALPNADGTVPAGEPTAYAPLEVVQTANADGGTQTSVTTVRHRRRRSPIRRRHSPTRTASSPRPMSTSPRNWSAR
jgi:flagellar basal body rod protein FlgC